MYSPATLVVILACVHYVRAQFPPGLFDFLPPRVQEVCKFKAVSKPTFKIQGDVLSAAEQNAGTINDVEVDSTDEVVAVRFVQAASGNGAIIEGLTASQVFVECESFADDAFKEDCEGILPYFKETREGCNSLRRSVSIAKVNARIGKVIRDSQSINKEGLVGSSQTIQFQGNSLDSQQGDKAQIVRGDGSQTSAEATAKISLQGNNVQSTSTTEAITTPDGAQSSSSVNIVGGK